MSISVQASLGALQQILRDNLPNPTTCGCQRNELLNFRWQKKKKKPAVQNGSFCSSQFKETLVEMQTVNCFTLRSTDVLCEDDANCSLFISVHLPTPYSETPSTNFITSERVHEI